MAGLASVADLQTLMKKTFSGDDLDEANLILDIVSSWARVQSGQQWPDAPTGVPTDVRGVVLIASRRELNNPQRVITRQMGPFNVTYSAAPDGFFSPAEIAILGRFRRSGGLRTVQVSRGEHGRPWAGTLRNPHYPDMPYEGKDSGDGFLLYDGSLFPAFGEDDPGYNESIHP